MIEALQDKPEPIVKIDNLCMEFGETVALDGVSFEIQRGEIFGFIGPNGAGKTTTIRILSALQDSTSGAAWIDGYNVAEEPEIVRRLIGYMPDDFGVYEGITIYEYLDFFAGAYRIPPGQRGSIIDGVLELTDLAQQRDRTVASLSKGMKQRLCLAKTLIHDPQVLILDEPASAMDPRARIELRELLRELRAMGKTILISSHILTELSDISTAYGIIERGKILEWGSMDRVKNRLATVIRVHMRFHAQAEKAVVFAYFFLFTGNRIRPSTDDRSSMLRLLTLVVLFTTLALAGLSLTTGMNDPSSGGVGVDSGGLGFLWWSAVITFFVGLYFSTESLLISGRLRRRFSQWSGIRFPFRLLVPGAFWGFLYTVVVVGFLSAVFYFVANYAPLTDLARTKFAGMAYTLPLYILAFSALGFFLSSCGFTQKDNFLTVFFIFVITLLLPLIFQHKNFSDGVLALYYLSPIMLYYSLTPDRFYEDEPQFVLFGEVPIIPVARRVFGLAAFVFFVMGLRAAQKEKLPLVRLGR